METPACSNVLQIEVPGSKSLAARLLVMAWLSGSKPQFHNLPDCDDTRCLRHALASLSHSDEIEIGEGGTTLRFLLAALASREAAVGESRRVLLIPDGRLRERPVGILVRALRRAGAVIEETARGWMVERGSLSGGRIPVEPGGSSQFVSAMMMAAPYWEKGGLLEPSSGYFETSLAYLRMTAHLMRHYGVDVCLDSKSSGSGEGLCGITVPRGQYDMRGDIWIESDWSGAANFLVLEKVAALKEIGVRPFEIPGLSETSLQGDRHILSYLSDMESAFLSGGELRIDMSLTPDLVQPVTVGCVMAGIPFSFTGLDTLPLKESDRIGALVHEMGRLGIILSAGRMLAGGKESLALHWDGRGRSGLHLPDGKANPWGDHRMAMSLGLMRLVLPGLEIDAPEVTSKSFPRYFDWLDKILSY